MSDTEINERMMSLANSIINEAHHDAAHLENYNSRYSDTEFTTPTDECDFNDVEMNDKPLVDLVDLLDQVAYVLDQCDNDQLTHIIEYAHVDIDMYDDESKPTSPNHQVYLAVKDSIAADDTLVDDVIDAIAEYTIYRIERDGTTPLRQCMCEYVVDDNGDPRDETEAFNIFEESYTSYAAGFYKPIGVNYDADWHMEFTLAGGGPSAWLRRDFDGDNLVVSWASTPQKYTDPALTIVLDYFQEWAQGLD